MGAHARFVLDSSGVVIEADDALAELLRIAPADLIGTRAIDHVALADRDNCYSLFHALMSDRRPLTTVKRLIRADETFVWARSSLHYREDGAGGVRIEVVAEPAATPGTVVEPHKLLRIAEFLAQAHEARTMVIDRRLTMDAAWAVLLAVYVSEARGEAFDPDRVFDALGLSHANAGRWVRTLIAEHLLVCDEAEDAATTPVDCAFRLTREAHERIERYLADLYHTLTPADRINMPA